MLAVLTTHPIQYQVPIWRELARCGEVPFEVWYLSDQGARHGLDPEFGREFCWDIEMLAGYPYRFLPTSPTPSDLSTFRGARIGSLSPLFDELKVKALWIEGWRLQANWQAAYQARNRGISVWLRGETNDLTRRGIARDLVRSPALRWLFHRINRFLYIGEANRREYLRLGVPMHKLVSTPYCVDNERFAASARAARSTRASLRARWNVPERAFCFLYAGKLIPKKRPADLLDALARLLERSPAVAHLVHVLVVGDGELMPLLQSRAAELADRHGRELVSFAGFLNQTEMPRAYAAADCLVLPSDSGETWGLVVNEALASGIPALVSDQCGCAEDLIAPMDSRLIFPCGRLDALALTLESVLTGHTSLPSIEQCHGAVTKNGVSVTVDTITREYAELSLVGDEHCNDRLRSEPVVPESC